MEITFVTSESGKTKYWGVQDGITFLQTGTKKAAEKLLNYLLEKNGLQPNLSNDISGEQVDSAPAPDTIENSDRLRANDFVRCDNSQEEQEDPGLGAWRETRARRDETRARLDETRAENLKLILEIADDYSRLVDATVKASLRSSSDRVRQLEPQTIDIQAT
jgi:hypothetical protein